MRNCWPRELAKIRRLDCIQHCCFTTTLCNFKVKVNSGCLVVGEHGNSDPVAVHV